MANPYRPGFNQAPAKLVGREDVLAAAREALETASLDARFPRPLVLCGARGVGKTVILGEIAELAGRQYGWPTVRIEIKPRAEFTGELVEKLTAVAGLLRQAKPAVDGKLTLKSVKLTAGALGLSGQMEIERKPSSVPALPLEAAAEQAASAAIDRGGGLVLAVDEAQLAAREELATLTGVLQQHVPDAWPLVFVLAGLPEIRDKDKSVTYLERAEWHELGLLGRDDAEMALLEPARVAGRPMDADAAKALAAASGGYPYAVQVLGHHAWRASAGSETIRLSHTEQAIDRSHSDFENGIFANRWEDASPREKEYLVALAELVDDRAGPVPGGDVARRLGKTPHQVSYLRERLLKKGTLVNSRGLLSFFIPGMAMWVRVSH